MYSSKSCRVLGAQTSSCSLGRANPAPSAVISPTSRRQHRSCHIGKPHPKYGSSNAVDSGSYPASSGDSRTQKATLEHILGADAALHFKDGAAGPVDGGDTPWGVGWQMTEKSLLWNDDIKLRFVKRNVSEELSISEQELEEKLQTLCNLLPDMMPRLMKAPPSQLAALAAGTHTVAGRLLQLRGIFPQANISQLLERRLSLLLKDDMAQIQAAAERLRQLLPYMHVDKFVESYPQVLEVVDFEQAMEDAKRLMPQIDVAHALRNTPDLILSLQKGKHLIPYDEPWPIKKA